jgi:hypothetical protein
MHILMRRIVGGVDAPGAGVTDDVAVGGLGEERPFPKRLRQRRKTQRGVEALAHLHHVNGAGLARLQNVGQRVAGVGAAGGDEIEDVAPVLRPDVAEQVRLESGPVSGTAAPYFSCSFMRT